MIKVYRLQLLVGKALLFQRLLDEKLKRFNDESCFGD